MFGSLRPGLFLGHPYRDLAKSLSTRRRVQPLAVEGNCSGEKSVEQHAERVAVAAGVELIEPGPLRADVVDRAHDLTELGEHRLLGQVLLDSRRWRRESQNTFV